MVAYFGRCLIIISKDKITSYHIWKIFLQSFSQELLATNGDGDYNMKTCREQNLRVCGKARSMSRWNPGGSPGLWIKSRCIFANTLMLQASFCNSRTKLWVPERVNNTGSNTKCCRKFWTIFVAIDMTQFEYQSLQVMYLRLPGWCHIPSK